MSFTSRKRPRFLRRLPLPTPTPCRHRLSLWVSQVRSLDSSTYLVYRLTVRVRVDFPRRRCVEGTTHGPPSHQGLDGLES